MKKCFHIGLSMLLSMLLLLIGSGVNIMHCHHTGRMKILTVLSSEAMHDAHCNQNFCCVTMQHVELAPMETAKTVKSDFHVVQPLLTFLPSLVTGWTTLTEHKAPQRFMPQVWRGNPRAYLNFIRILLI
jgi:hypothetical protein